MYPYREWQGFFIEENQKNEKNENNGNKEKNGKIAYKRKDRINVGMGHFSLTEICTVKLKTDKYER